MSNPVFIVSTGRCGSTVLARALSEVPDLLVLSELFVTIDVEAFGNTPMNGPLFWKCLSRCNAHTRELLRHGLATREYLRRDHAELSPLLITTLPFLTANADALYREAEQFVCSLPIELPGRQFSKLFDWLAEQLGRRVWVERSGGSLRHVDKLVELFPEARFIHLCRDGRECAISMSRHHAYRLALARNMIEERIGVDPWREETSAELRAGLGELERLLPDQFDRHAYDQLEIPLERFGKLWCSQVLRGLAALNRLPKDRVYTVKYEHLMTNARLYLSDVVSFIALQGTSLHAKRSLRAEAVASILTRVESEWQMPELRWPRLPAGDRESLQHACKIGMGLLRYRHCQSIEFAQQGVRQ